MAIALACASPQARAQTQPSTPSVSTAIEAPPAASAATSDLTVRIPAGTVIQVELAEPLSSRSAQIGQLFGLRLAAPIVVDGREVAPAGAAGGGEVIDAHAAAFGGRQGRLIISGRYIEINGERVRIRGMQITAAGEDRGNTALAVTMIPYAGVAGIFVQGGQVEIPAGASGTARLAADVAVPTPAPQTAVQEPPPQGPSTQSTPSTQETPQ